MFYGILNIGILQFYAKSCLYVYILDIYVLYTNSWKVTLFLNESQHFCLHTVYGFECRFPIKIIPFAQNQMVLMLKIQSNINHLFKHSQMVSRLAIKD